MVQFLKHTSNLSQTLFIADDLAAKIQDTCNEYNGRLHHSVILEIVQSRHGLECMLFAAYLLGQMTGKQSVNDQLNNLVNRIYQN